MVAVGGMSNPKCVPLKEEMERRAHEEHERKILLKPSM